MWYLTLRVVEEYREEHGKYPGLSDIEDKTEFDAIYGKLSQIVSKITPDQKPDERFVKEILRFADSKIHTVAAFLGGIASQEIIKLLIKQYTILNSTLIYDGIYGRCATYE